jgi:hypothetical protein
VWQECAPTVWCAWLRQVDGDCGVERNGAPFADLPEALQRLRRVLLLQDGGDRLTAEVLAMVPAAGLEAVVVTADLALQSAPRSLDR